MQQHVLRKAFHGDLILIGRLNARVVLAHVFLLIPIRLALSAKGDMRLRKGLCFKSVHGRYAVPQQGRKAGRQQTSPGMLIDLGRTARMVQPINKAVGHEIDAARLRVFPRISRHLRQTHRHFCLLAVLCVNGHQLAGRIQKGQHSQQRALPRHAQAAEASVGYLLHRARGQITLQKPIRKHGAGIPHQKINGIRQHDRVIQNRRIVHGLHKGAVIHGAYAAHVHMMLRNADLIDARKALRDAVDRVSIVRQQITEARSHGHRRIGLRIQQRIGRGNLLQGIDVIVAVQRRNGIILIQIQRIL